MTTVLSDAGVMFADGSFVASAKELMHVNDIVNGGFTVAQIGMSFAAAVSGSYDLDGWTNERVSTAAYNVAQVTGSSSGRLARQVTITTAAATIATGDYVADITRIEGYNIEKYVGNTFTIGFRARVPVAGIHCVALRNIDPVTRSYVAEINFPVANVYQNCSITVVGGLPTAGTWNYINGTGLAVWFVHAVGTTFQTTPNAWQTGNFFGTANQVNDCATLSNVWAMEKVTLNLGTVAAVSEISFEQELIRCMRYFENSNGGGGVANVLDAFVVVPTIAGRYPSWPFRVGKRIPNPSLIPLFSGGTGATLAATQGSFYQSANHSADATFGWTAAARL